MSQFFFRRRRDRVNWRMLGALDVHGIQRETDVAALQEVIDNITFCDIEGEDVRYVDPNFVRMFQVSQLIIEYLLYCQNALQETEQSAQKKNSLLENELNKFKEQSEKQLLELYTLKREQKSLKKAVYAYQIMTKNKQSSRCKYCPKAFENMEYLQNHVKRRHQDVDQDIMKKLSGTMEDLSVRLLEAEKKLRNECEERMKKEIEIRQNELEIKQKQEYDRVMMEFDECKKKVDSDLQMEKNQLSKERDMLEKLRLELINLKKTLKTSSAQTYFVEPSIETQTEQDIPQQVYEEVEEEVEEEVHKEKQEEVNEEEVHEVKEEKVKKVKFDNQKKLTIQIDNEWDKISRHLKTHRQSMVHAPWIKSLFLHPLVLVLNAKEEEKNTLCQELLQRKVTRADLQHLSSDPCYPLMFDLILEHVQEITKQVFKFKPKPFIQKPLLLRYQSKKEQKLPFWPQSASRPSAIPRKQSINVAGFSYAYHTPNKSPNKSPIIPKSPISAISTITNKSPLTIKTPTNKSPIITNKSPIITNKSPVSAIIQKETKNEKTLSDWDVESL